MIIRAFTRAKIKTYPQLYKKAKAEYNLFYINGLNTKLINEIQKYLLMTGRKGLSDYETNLKEKPKAARKRRRTEKILREYLDLAKRQTKLMDMY